MTGTDDEQPPSISSLRSKFENLAAASGSAGGRSASTGAVSSNGKAKAVEDGAPAAGSRGGVGRPAARDGLEQSKPQLEADGPGHSNINGRLRRVSPFAKVIQVLSMLVTRYPILQLDLCSPNPPTRPRHLLLHHLQNLMYMYKRPLKSL
jgi:hypothetical protein